MCTHDTKQTSPKCTLTRLSTCGFGIGSEKTHEKPFVDQCLKILLLHFAYLENPQPYTCNNARHGHPTVSKMAALQNQFLPLVWNYFILINTSPTL